MQLRPLSEQTLVVTGASSGIGLATARMAAEHGARIVVGARSEAALRRLIEEFRGKGVDAAYAVCDVRDQEDIDRLAETALSRYGGFDTWVNNAGVSIYGRLEDVPIDDHRELFETNFWGTVMGSLTALRYLRETGGAIINIGSSLSDRSIPLQGMYSASKHAVKAFTDALRMEVEQARLPISLTLVKPGAIDTPYAQHAISYLGVEPKNPPPYYSPRAVARAILHAAQRPERDIIVGGGGKAISLMERFPRFADWVMERTLFSAQRTSRPVDESDDGLWEGSGNLQETGGNRGPVFERSMYTTAALHPAITLSALGLAGFAAARMLRANGTGEKEPPQKGTIPRRRQQPPASWTDETYGIQEGL